MPDNAAFTDSTLPQQASIISTINSPLWLGIGRTAFWAFLIIAIIFTGKVSIVAFGYFSELAAAQLGNSSILVSLYPWIMVIGRLIIHSVFILVGVFVFWQRSRERMGLYAALTMITFGSGGLEFYFALPQMTPYLINHNLLWGFYLTSPIGWMLSGLVLQIFPDGRFVPRWLRYFALTIPLPILIWHVPSDSLLYAYNSPALILMSVIYASVGCYAIYYRYRFVSTATQRQQIKWIVFTSFLYFAIYFTVLLLPIFLPNIFTLGSLSFHTALMLGQGSTLLLPFALVVSIMRYRLWDIDLVINRSLVYGTVTVIIMFIFGLLLFGLQALTAQTQTVLVILLSAIISLLIYKPLSRRIQHAVDSNIYRLRFDLNEVQAAQKTPEIKNPGALTGRKLGQYEVQDLLGKGGMGEVYRAVANGKTVAIKTMLNESTLNEELQERFRREAQVGMRLQHPNIVRVHSIDQEGTLIYMVMDYLEGDDLSKRLKLEGKLESQEVIEIVSKLSEALAAAHENGLVHRDIKPSNVMLISNPDDETYGVVLMDFGLTKVSGAKSLTNASAMGTIDYMAPEQILKAHEVDHRADIYSLGIMSYEMLVGERPFTGNVGQVLFAHLQQPAPDPREANQDVPRSLAKAILKSLEKDPDNRFQSVLELSQAIQAVTSPSDNMI